MAANTAAVGYGVLLKRGDGAGSEAFTSITELKSVSGPNFSLDVSEASHTASPSAAKEFVAAMIDAGEVTFECNFVMDGTQNLAAGILLDLKNRTKRNFQIAWPTATASTISFAGFVTGWSPKVAINDVMTVEIKIKITGLPTIA